MTSVKSIQIVTMLDQARGTRGVFRGYAPHHNNITNQSHSKNQMRERLRQKLKQKKEKENKKN